MTQFTFSLIYSNVHKGCAIISKEKCKHFPICLFHLLSAAEFNSQFDICDFSKILQQLLNTFFFFKCTDIYVSQRMNWISLFYMHLYHLSHLVFAAYSRFPDKVPLSHTSVVIWMASRVDPPIPSFIIIIIINSFLILHFDGKVRLTSEHLQKHLQAG